MLPSKSAEHRRRILENQTKIAAERDASGPKQVDLQLKIPLLVEVKRGAETKEQRARKRRNSKTDQPDLGKL